MLMFLCSICNTANGGRFAEGDCHICGNAALRCDGMAQKGAQMLRESGAKSFSISTNIDKEWLAREEKAWDSCIRNAESIKNFLNRRLSSALRRASGAEYEPEGECRLVFDFATGTVELKRCDIFIFGRYMKRSPGLSQSRWKCPKCDGKGCAGCEGKGKYYESVEERIGEPVKAAAGAKDYVMHASGREDVDATNSAGRPFVLEVNEPQAGAGALDLGALAGGIALGGDVGVTHLRLVSRSFTEIVTESHFDKTYEAEVEFERDVGEAEGGMIRSLEGATLLQQTPTRVAHRRADLVRHRKVKHLEFVRRSGQDARHATLIIKAEAGTYIKELISGDSGRTNPSISGRIGMKAKCTRLEVVGMDDGYLDFCLAADAMK
jgi:tRNA pseudouridine synthase 10